MNKSKSVVVAIIGAISLFINLSLFIFNSYVSMYPDEARKIFGDKFMNWFMNLPLPTIIVILVIIFIVCLIFSLWTAGIFDKKSEVIQPPLSSPTNQQIVKDHATGLQNPTFNAPVTFGQTDDKKKEEAERLSKPEITFPPRWKHFDDIVIKGSDPKQIMACIKVEGMASWFVYLIVDKTIQTFVYDVDHADTNFYDPEKDNTILYGAIFSTIKYRLIIGENGVHHRTQIEKTHEMFTVSIIPSGTGNESISTIIFDTSNIDALGFYDRMKEGLSKRFTVLLDVPLIERIPVHILSPAIMIENNDHRDWKNCRLVIDKVNEKSTKERFCWSEALSIGQITYMVDCLDGEKIFSSLESMTNQNALRKIVGATLSNENFLSGVCEIYATFYASTVNGESIRREVYIKAEFSDNIMPSKYGKIINVKILEAR